MKKFITLIVLAFLLTVSNSFAADWNTVQECCKWSGTEGIDCLPVKRAGINNRPYITLPDGNNISTLAILYAEGYYPVTVTEPDMSTFTYPVKYEEDWEKVGNDLTKTWKVREKNDTEIAEFMPYDAYLIWKILITETDLTANQVTPYLTQEKIDGYLARQRLGQ